MFVYTQHTRSVHTAYTQCSVYTQRTHSAHTLMGHSESPSEYAVCTCCVYAVCTLCVTCHFFNEDVEFLFVDVLRTKEVDKSPMIFTHSLTDLCIQLSADQIER